ncbi:MAG: tyrosine-type recombinase/integrase [Ignavibacterium sp.]|nr:tyrosine-type recombinase/integrase [Ignavibacterium sp.]
MATVRTKNGKLFIDYRVNGKRKREFLKLEDTRENRKKAEIVKKQIEYESSAGIFKERIGRVDRKHKLLQDAYQEFIANNPNRKQSTIIGYDNAFEKFLGYAGNIKVKEVDKDLFKAFESHLRTEIIPVKKKPLSDNTIGTYFHRLKIMFKYFIEQDYISENPVPKKEVKPKEIRVLSDKEILTLLEKIKNTDKKHLIETKHQHYKLIVMLLMTGLRITELINLTFDDIDFKENLIRVRNEKKDRIDYLPLYEELKIFILQEWKERTGRLFNYKSKESLKFFRRFLEKEKMQGFSFHTFRKTFITKLINSGLSVFDVMTLARHKDIRTTLRHYTAAELHRIGKEISFKSNLGTILGTKTENELKLLKFK